MRKDYYLIFHVPPEASFDQIRSAYRRRALELHPDLTGLGSEQFLELQEPYNVLSNPDRRKIYDRKGDETPLRPRDARGSPEDIIGRGHRAEPLTTTQRASEFDDLSLFRSFETFSPSFDQLFERLWSNFNLRTRPKAERLESLNVEVPLSPRQAFAGGGDVLVMVPSRLVCPACHGQGSIGPYECSQCEGHGAVTGEYPVTVSYPAGLQEDYIVRIPLERFGIQNFYLSVQFRPTASIW